MNSSVQIAVDLLSALLTGGFLLFFIEIMHIESDVKQRFKSIMNPFYHTLSKMSVFVHYMRSALVSTSNELLDALKIDMDYISKAGVVPCSSGRDIPYMKSDELDNLCETFNNIWYRLDRSPDLRRNITLDERMIDIARDALSEVYPRFNEKKLDVNALMDASGAFYVDYWQPVEHCTPNYEYWEKKAFITRTLIYVALGLSLVSLITTMIWADCICPVIPCALAILSSTVFAIGVGMMAYLMSLSNRLFRMA